MGKLYYGNAIEPVEMPDRTLAHVKTLITTKLRRSESFSLSWDRVVDGEVQRSGIWLQSSIPLRFELSAEAATKLDMAYLQQLAQAANSSAGVIIDLCEAPIETEVQTIPRISELGRAA